MHVEFEEMLLELVPGDHLNENIYKLKKLANVAGLLVSLSTFYRRYWENMGKDKGELFS